MLARHLIEQVNEITIFYYVLPSLSRMFPVKNKWNLKFTAMAKKLQFNNILFWIE